MHVFVASANGWLDSHIRETIRRHIPSAIFHDAITDFPDDADSTIQICNGWHLNPHFSVHNKATSKALLNAYPSSDGVSRKDHLARIAECWTAKRPFSPLSKHWPTTVRLSLDYADYVDESLAAADDLTCMYSLEDNEGKDLKDREWWILKPAMIDCGAGIRIFSTMDELAACLEEAESDDSCGSESDGYEEPAPTLAGSYKPTKEEEEASNNPLLKLSTPGLDALDGLVTATGQHKINIPTSDVAIQRSQAWLTDANARIPSASLRDFVAQRYIVNLPPVEERKWHVRAYVLSLGRLKVYVYKEMIALLAAEPYQPPWEEPSLKSSLTNTSFQTADQIDELNSMRDFFKDFPDDLIPGVKDWKHSVFDQICEISGEIMRAAAHTMADKFTPLDSCFELFAVDYLVDTAGTVWLMEVNETPAFYQAGIAGPLSTRLMDSVMSVAMGHIGYDAGDENEVRDRLREVLDESNMLGKSNIAMIVPEE